MPSRDSIRKWLPLGGALGFFLLGVMLRLFMPKPYVWLFSFASWAVACAFLAARFRSGAGLYLCLTAMSTFLALFAAEGWLALQEPGRPGSPVTIEELRATHGDPELLPFGANRLRDDPLLGYRPRPKADRVASRVVHDGKIIYDVVYSSLDSGWRVTPQFPEADKAVVFFGCSFTIGEGLNDGDSIPYRVGELLGSGYQVFNFAYHGYGSHHMLAQIENGYLDDIRARYKKILVVYPTIKLHELRCSGMSYWDNRGPWYVRKDGTLVYNGPFTHNPVSKNPPGHKLLRNCLIYKHLTAEKLDRLGPLQELHADIIAQSARLARENYSAGFLAVLWPGAPYAELLRERNIACLDLAPEFPEWDAHPERYVIPMDGHPNRFSADRVARLLAEQAQDRLAD